MSRPRVPKLKYRRDRRTGRGRAVWKDHSGGWHRKTLPGLFKTPESLTAFEDLKLAVKASATGTAPKKPPLTMAGLLEAYLKHAERYYRGPDGKPTSTIHQHRIVARALCEQHPHKPAAGFGSLLLKEAVQRWVNKGCTRTECNRRLGITKSIFKWAASEEIVPAAVYHAITTVSGLKRGRTAARETDRVRPVDEAVVDATLPHLNRYVAGLVQLQRHTGMRPGEVCTIRGRDIDTTDPEAWVYTLPHHKTAHQGLSRVVFIGPRGREVLHPFLKPDDPAAYLFPASAAMAELREQRRKERKTPLFPSHQERNRRKRKKRPRRNPYRPYRPANYALAIRRACLTAFPPPAPLARRPGESQKTWMARLTPDQKAELRAWWVAHRWHPNQLRHNFGTQARKQFGVEASRVLLGHADAGVTEIYAERDLTLAAAVAAKIG
jgi:integrase